MWGFVSVMLAISSYSCRPRHILFVSEPVDGPQAYHSTPLPGAIKEDAMQVGVTRDGRLFFRYNQVGLEDLQEEIRKGVRNGAEKRIYLAADARAKYGDAKAVLEQIWLAGIEDVSFLTEKPYR